MHVRVPATAVVEGTGSDMDIADQGKGTATGPDTLTGISLQGGAQTCTCTTELACAPNTQNANARTLPATAAALTHRRRWRAASRCERETQRQAQDLGWARSGASESVKRTGGRYVRRDTFRTEIDTQPWYCTCRCGVGSRVSTGSRVPGERALLEETLCGRAPLDS
jgi:hypothetical protein